jgi:adenylate cyclase
VEGVLTRFVGEFRFVGKSEPLPIHELLAGRVADDHPRALLKARFDAAMDVLGAGQWLAAAAAFEAILRDHPDDGPSRFHLERCKRFEAAPPAHAPWVVHMDSK